MTKTTAKENYKLQLLLIDFLKSYNRLNSANLGGIYLQALIVNYDLKIRDLLRKEAV